MSLTSRILKTHKTGKAAGAYDWYRPDLILVPEYALALMKDNFEKTGWLPHDPAKVTVTADHFCPPASSERADILKQVKQLCVKLGFEMGMANGICHQVMVENPAALPGCLIVGSDSHTITAGALGCLACGFGSTDVFAAVTKDQIALTTPPAILVRFEGKMPENVFGKDLILHVMSQLGYEKMHWASLEFYDCTQNGISMDSRLSMCNTAVEGGVKFATFIPDAITGEFLSKRQQDGFEDIINLFKDSAADTDYVFEIKVDVSTLEPLAACPHDPLNIKKVKDIGNVKLDQVFIGSCAAGRLEDLEAAASILENKSVYPMLSAVVIPASARVYLEALQNGCLEKLVRAGVCVSNPSCGPCGAIDKGILGDNQVCAATINRNYRGRMGSPKASIYLVNPAVAAASMLKGKISLP